MKMPKIMKKVLMFVLVISLFTGMIPLSAFAAEEQDPGRTLVCEMEEHTHGEECYSGPQLICGLEESEEHTHSVECYGEPELICEKEEHTHSEECFADNSTVISLDEPEDKAETSDLSALLSTVEITDESGAAVENKLQLGQKYHIHLAFAENDVDGLQFAVSGTLTYQIPTLFEVAPRGNESLLVNIDGNPMEVGTYSIDEAGLLTINLTDDGRAALDRVYNANLTFEMEATAEAGRGGAGGSVSFGGAGRDFTFEVVDQPQVTMKKTGRFTENADRTGGILDYTVTVKVDHGTVENGVVKDTLTPPQNSAFKFEMAGEPTVTLIRDGVEVILGSGDYDLVSEEADPANPYKQTFKVVLKSETCDPLKVGDELKVTYKYNATCVPGSTEALWANALNEATFTGTMPVPDPAYPDKTTDVPVEETQASSVEVRVTPDGHGVVCKEQSYSEATKTLHYTLYTVVPAGEWTPLYIFDDMVVEYEGKKWYLQEFNDDGGRVENLKVSAVDVEHWFDWDESTSGSEKIRDMQKLRSSADTLQGFNFFDDNMEGYDRGNLDQYVYRKGGSSLYIIFGFENIGKWSNWGKWGSWNYSKDRLIITEYDLDMSGNDEITLAQMGNKDNTLNLTPDEVLLAGITNNVNLRYGGYYPGYCVFFNNADRLNKTGKLNKAEGTIDYTVTLNTTDETVRNYFMSVKADWYAQAGRFGWSFNKMYPDSMQAELYDVLPEGWEYVDGSLYAVARDIYGNEETFDTLDGITNPTDNDGNIEVPLVCFCNPTHVCREFFNTFGDTLAELSFHYQLKATDKWKADNATANNPVEVLNHAEIKDKTGTHWSDDAKVDYYPAKLNKKAEHVDDSNLMRFTIDVNPYGDDFLDGSDFLTVTDESINLQIDLDSIKVADADGSPVEFKVLPAAEKGQFKLQVPDGKALTITYNALIVDKGPGVPVSNRANIEGVKNADSGYEATLAVNRIWSDGSGSTSRMTVEKTDSTDGTKVLAGAKFKFYLILSEGSVLDSNAEIGGRAAYTEDDWTFTTGGDGRWTGGWRLGVGHYYALEELQAPEGYKLAEEPVVFYYGFESGMDAVSYPGAAAVIPSGTLTVTNEPETPEEPKDPEDPEDPKDPEPSGTPEEPRNPETPEPSEIPEEPKEPETPEIPDEPKKSEEPKEPEVTETPEEPTAPDEPREEIPDDDLPKAEVSETPDEPGEEIPDDDLPKTEAPKNIKASVSVLLTEIREEQTPLAQSPEKQADLTEIQEASVPMSDAPRTGDNSQTLLWLVLMMASAMSLCALGFCGRRRENDEK